MPVGNYQTFGQCVGAQMRKGYSRDVAQRICGKIERDSNKKRNMKGALLSKQEHEAIEKEAVNDARADYGLK